jgi:hypothetical protein
MKRLLVLCAILATSQSAALAATELLTNPGLDVLDSDNNPNPALYYDKPLGWEIETDPCSYSPCTIARYPGFPATYADRPQAGGNGIVFNSTEGNYPGYEFEGYDAVDAILTQSVPAIVGQKYRMTGHAYFEAGYAGGVETIHPDSPSTHAGLPSVTDTFFALEFLDMNGDPLPGSKRSERG